MTKDEIEYGKRLMSTASDIIGTLNPKTIKGAINWGDLDCVLVEKVEALDIGGNVETAWRVVIEEASPAAFELNTAVYNGLVAEGFENVEVQSDW